MDPRNLDCYEFLDLSDVEEHERRELKKTLYSEGTPEFLELPWIIKNSTSEWQKGLYDDDREQMSNGPVGVVADRGSVPVSQHVPAVSMYSAPAAYTVGPPPSPAYQHPQNVFSNVSMHGYVPGHYVAPAAHYTVHEAATAPGPGPHRGRARGRGTKRPDALVESAGSPGFSPPFMPIHYHHPPAAYYPTTVPPTMQHPSAHNAAGSPLYIAPFYSTPVYGAYAHPQQQYYSAPPPPQAQPPLMEDPVPEMTDLSIEQPPNMLPPPPPPPAHQQPQQQPQQPQQQQQQQQPAPPPRNDVIQPYPTSDTNTDQSMPENNCYTKHHSSEPAYLNNNHIELGDTDDKKLPPPPEHLEPVVNNNTSAPPAKPAPSAKPVNKVSPPKGDTNIAPAKHEPSNSNVSVPRVTAPQTVVDSPTSPVNNVPAAELQPNNVDSISKPVASCPSSDNSVVCVNTKPEPEEQVAANVSAPVSAPSAAAASVPAATPAPVAAATPAPAPLPSKSWASLFQNSQSSVNNVDAAKTSAKAPATINTTKPAVDDKVAPRNTTDTNIAHPNPPAITRDPNSYKVGEFLSKYTLDNRTVTVQPRGLTNRSNYCYINSILQALLACPPFYNLLKAMPVQQRKSSSLKSTMPIIDSMTEFVNEFIPMAGDTRLYRKERGQRKDNIDVTCGTAFEPSRIYTILNGIRTDTFIVEGRQEDAEEFFGCLVNGLNDEMLELMKLVDPGNHENLSNGDINNKDSDGPDEVEWRVMGPKNKGSITRRAEFGRTPISDIFRGQLRSRVHRTGDQVTDNVQPFFTLQLDIEKASSVHEALEQLVNKDKLEGVTCSRTNQQVEAWQQVLIEELPLVMVLHLKCFHYKLDACTKIIKAVDFPVDLKIDSKLLSPNAKYNGKQKQYKLFAVVCHDGKEATKGHYLTDAYHAGYGGWVRYDDATVKSVQENHVLHPNATRVPYLLFYRRCDTMGGGQQQHQQQQHHGPKRD